MKLHYEVEWELEDEIIDNIVNEVENTLEQYPDCDVDDCDVDDCISEITADNLSEMDYDECDQFNMEVYFDKVTEEVKKRYLGHKPKMVILPTTPAEGLHSGYIQRMDDLGRILIPMNLRNILNLEGGDPFEIFFDTEKNLILKKYHG